MGAGVGLLVGFAVGCGLGFAVGFGVGVAVGFGVGVAVGFGVGESVVAVSTSKEKLIINYYYSCFWVNTINFTCEEKPNENNYRK